MPANHNSIKFGAVAIGRNESERLYACLRSLSAAAAVIYVDSGSTDGSVQYARRHGAEVVELDMRAPFTAARARNAGFRHLRSIAPDLLYVQFVDGDCELDSNWPAQAISFLVSNPSIVAVCGLRRERFPNRSVYNWMCDLEWKWPPGEARYFGGDVMLRADALERLGGYRDDLIAGEEPELCVRLRATGWRIWRLDANMTLHDAAMTSFGQWWRRTLRSGYAYAQGAYLHGAPPEQHWVWETRRAWLWSVWLPLFCLTAGLTLRPWGWLVWLVYPLQWLRQVIRNRGSLRDRLTLASFQLLTRLPEGLGAMKFTRDRLLGRRTHLIEYK